LSDRYSAPRRLVVVAVETDRGLADMLDEIEHRLAFLRPTVSPRMRPRRRISSRSGTSFTGIWVAFTLRIVG
jgi:hypothetical protein